MMHDPLRSFALLVFLGLAACAPPPLFYWGQYEESLYKRHRDPSDQGQAEAFKMLELTIQEAEAKNSRVPPGVYADYGYLLFKQGKADDAVVFFRKEAETYKESKHLMDSLISRIERKKAP
ncbi:MAG: DUF4810 domain-containing protein [Candidatus Methylomirabilales bacterium]